MQFTIVEQVMLGRESPDVNVRAAVLGEQRHATVANQQPSAQGVTLVDGYAFLVQNEG